MITNQVPFVTGTSLSTSSAGPTLKTSSTKTIATAKAKNSCPRADLLARLALASPSSCAA